MSSIIDVLVLGLTVLVLLIAAGSLLFVGSLPIARLRTRWRARHDDAD